MGESDWSWAGSIATSPSGASSGSSGPNRRLKRDVARSFLGECFIAEIISPRPAARFNWRLITMVVRLGKPDCPVAVTASDAAGGVTGCPTRCRSRRTDRRGWRNGLGSSWHGPACVAQTAARRGPRRLATVVPAVRVQEAENKKMNENQRSHERLNSR